MINKINNHFILVDRCAEETRILEVFEKKIIKLITWFDKNPPLIGNIYNAVIVKKLNGGVARAKIYDKSILTIRGVPNSIKVNTSVRIIVTSDKINNKPIQSKLIEPNSKFEEKIKNLDQINKIILLFFPKKLPIIKDEFSILWHELNLDKCYFDALKPKIKLNKGGVIWIEKTNAATLIDIDTKNLSIKTEDHMLKFCELAFVKCMEEIKLRNIGGMVLIDFPKLSNIRRKTFSNYLAETGKKYICDGIFFGFSRLLLYEMYIPRNFKLIENFYKNIDEFHFQNHLRSLWRVSKKLKSKSNVKFLCGKKLYKKIKIKSLPRYIDIIERTDLPCNYGEIVENF